MGRRQIAVPLSDSAAAPRTLTPFHSCFMDIPKQMPPRQNLRSSTTLKTRSTSEFRITKEERKEEKRKLGDKQKKKAKTCCEPVDIEPNPRLPQTKKRTNISADLLLKEKNNRTQQRQSRGTTRVRLRATSPLLGWHFSPCFNFATGA